MLGTSNTSPPFPPRRPRFRRVPLDLEERLGERSYDLVSCSDRSIMAFVGKLTACVLVLVFAAGASAATCEDGSNPGSNGCCAATQECPPCLVSEAISAGANTQCQCGVCAGDTVTLDSACSSSTCADDNGMQTPDKACEMCTTYGSDGSGTTCIIPPMPATCICERMDYQSTPAACSRPREVEAPHAMRAAPSARVTARRMLPSQSARLATPARQ